uniref:AT-rich interactive domain-containing protein 3 n=1 Tax=Malurus cyaneus samueli TaxID=2593467 RepID=A0A8C5UDB1_9PASS
SATAHELVPRHTRHGMPPLAPGPGSLWHPRHGGGTVLKRFCAEQAVGAKNNRDQRSREEPGPGTVLAAWELLQHGSAQAHLSPLAAQLYELDGDPRRKEFLDDLFSFMQKRGTPVNRIPIMAKQVLDLYMLYTLVTEKGGLVEVINKKLWREITKGLSLPTSITSAAFTLRTQYMKYLYPYECEKRGLSNPNELQAAIDSNRREGRRQGFGGSLFAYSPGGTHGLLSSPKLPVPALGLASATNGGAIAPGQKIKKGKSCCGVWLLQGLATSEGLPWTPLPMGWGLPRATLLPPFTPFPGMAVEPAAQPPALSPGVLFAQTPGPSSSSSSSSSSPPTAKAP